MEVSYNRSLNTGALSYAIMNTHILSTTWTKARRAPFSCWLFTI